MTVMCQRPLSPKRNRIHILIGLLAGILLCTAMLCMTASASDAAPSVQIDIQASENGYLEAVILLRGENLQRTQCIALAYDREVLFALSADQNGVWLPLDFQYPNGLPTEPTEMTARDIAVMENGFTADVCRSAVCTSPDGSVGYLFLYPTAKNPQTFADDTPVCRLTFLQRSGSELKEDTLRLLTYAEQRSYHQSAKILLCTADSYATYGSLNGGDTVAAPTVISDTAINGTFTDTPLVINTPWKNPFTDIDSSVSYYDAIAYVCKSKLFIGSSQTTFSPNASMTRATFATVLCRLAGDEEKTLASPPQIPDFADVGKDEWFTPYVAWAVENEMFYGYNNGCFGPNDNITHEQMYLLIKRFTEKYGYLTNPWEDAPIHSVSDAAEISDWAVDGVRFAFANRLLIADDRMCIYPTKAAGRWELAVLLYQMAGMKTTASAVGEIRDTMTAAGTDDPLLLDAYQQIYNGLLTLSDRINLSAYALDYEELILVYTEAAKQAEFFYVGNQFNYTYNQATGEILYITPTYTMRGAALLQAQAVYEAEIERLLSGIDLSWSEMERVLYLHDTLALEYIYDESSKNFDVYTFITTGRGVCQGYTMLLQALLRQLGIPCERATSISLNHTWNLVKLDGHWYHVDITWDDPIPNQHGQVQHDYFLRSDSAMAASGRATYTTFRQIQCTDTRYDNSLFPNVHTPFVFHNGSWYYISNQTGMLSAVDFSRGEVRSILETDMKWTTSQGTYLNLYTGLSLYGSTLIYNTADTLMAYHIASGVTQVLYTHTEGGYLCGSTVIAEAGIGGASSLYAVCSVRSSPSDSNQLQKKIPLDNLLSYTLSGKIAGYFGNTGARITLLRNGAVVRTLSLAATDTFLWTELPFSISGIRPGQYELLIEQSNRFSCTLTSLVVGGDIDLTEVSTPAVYPLVGGDLNIDGKITEADTALLLSSGTFREKRETAQYKEADLNGDGYIDAVDLAILTDPVGYGKSKSAFVFRIPAA
ncbi:MAG: S-layer homology domain-containing protein [Clostridia bacterium]|nr:S-layer homology domain-containing protein [Clostridia bacterium]